MNTVRGQRNGAPGDGKERRTWRRNGDGNRPRCCPSRSAGDMCVCVHVCCEVISADYMEDATVEVWIIYVEDTSVEVRII